MKITVALAVTLLAVGSFAADAPVVPAQEVPTVGTSAPVFTLENQEGAKMTLDQFRGKWVVLYFYPKDFTSGCTLEAHNFQRDLEKYHAANAMIVGVSVDDPKSHKQFCEKESLDFHLLADVDKNVSRSYGTTMEYEGNTYAARNTFLIDPKGVIRKVYMKVKPAEHSEQVLADLAQLQSAK